MAGNSSGTTTSSSFVTALGIFGVATVSTLLEANKLARRALVWAQTPLRTFVHVEMSVIGWSDASWACRREGSSQGGYIIGVANKTFMEQAESPLSVISWHTGKLARMARSSNSADLQAAADAQGELSYIRLSLNLSEKQFHFNVGKRQLLRSQVHWCWILVECTMHLHEVNQLVWRTRGQVWRLCR